MSAEKQNEELTQSENHRVERAAAQKRGGKWLWPVLGILALLLTAAAVIYAAVAMHYRTCFFPNTTINGMDCGGLEAETAAEMLDKDVDHYRLTVTGRDCGTGETGVVLGEILPKDIDLAYVDLKEETQRLLEEQNEWNWIPAHLGQKTYSYQLPQGVTFDEEKLEALLSSWDALKKENMRKAQDAYISQYSAKINGYEILPERTGTEVSPEEVLQAAKESITDQSTVLDLEKLGLYQDPAVRKDDKALQEAVATANLWLTASITYDWNGNEVLLDRELLKEWVSVEKDKAVLDEKEIENFVRKQASQYDTYGKDRKFKTTLGVELTLPSGYYGWKTDTVAETEELLALIRQGEKTQREPVYSSTARQKGKSDIGDSYVEADMTHQHLYLYNNGKLVLETDFVSGNMSDDSATPEGVFGIAYKTTNAVLRGRDYVTPVTYWMPYYNNYGMHDATWRDEFGGDIYLTEGSHGCLNLPLDKAGEIYQYMSKGFPVICYYYDVDPLAGQEPEEGKIVYEFNPWADDEEDE